MEEEHTLEFELPVAPAKSNPFAAHSSIAKLLGISSEDTLLWRMFEILSGICDPFTQPEDNDAVPLSVHTLSGVAITLSYQTLLDIRRQVARNEAHDARKSDSASDAELSDSESEDTRRISKEPWTTYESPDVSSLRFTLSIKFFAILQAISKVLRADDELRVRYLHNDVKNWEKTAKYWLPSLGKGLGEPADGLDPHDAQFSDSWSSLKLIYYICCVVIMALHRLFAPQDDRPYNQALNPYSEHFLRLWKTHTSIIALALEMDRELEEEAWATKSEYLDTPYLVKRTLLGSSAVRSVLAYVLEPTHGKTFSHTNITKTEPPESAFQSGTSVPRASDISPQLADNGRPRLENDLCNDSLINFYDPLARTAKACGAINSDKRLHAVLALVRRSFLPISPFSNHNSPDPNFDLLVIPHFDPEDYYSRTLGRLTPYGSATDLSIDIYYQDQFDDDIKYVFGYFDSEDEASGSENDNDSEKSSVIYGMAERQKEDEIEFDEQGRDWRDCARGKNNEFTPVFLELEAESKKLGDERLSDHFFFTWFELQQALEFLALAKIENVDTFIDRVGQVTVDTVAKAIRDEMLGRQSKISPDKIHKHLVSPVRQELLSKAVEELPMPFFSPTTNFELILLRNPYCALALLDELFMCKGLRRSLIWFLTHSVNPSIMYITYMYELVSGMRGNSGKLQSKYRFSRQGYLEITPVEQSMILHELFICAGTFATAAEAKMPQSAAIRSIQCLCVMIKNLVSINIIKKNTDDQFENYAHDIQVLLFPWIGKIPEARELFFLFKSDEYRPASEPDSGPQPEVANDDENVNDDILAVVNSLRDLDPEEYAKRSSEKATQDTFVNFAKRIFNHLNVHFDDARPFPIAVPRTYSASQDYGLFLAHFNEFARNSTFVDTITNILEEYEAMKSHADKLESWDLFSDPIETQLDSEFSDAFLNGEGDFQDTSKSNDKKKKKKPKKKRGKKK